MKINERISLLRKEKQMSQEELAERLDISIQTISNWESGLNSLDITLIPELAKVLEVSISELFGEIISKDEEITYDDNIKVVVMKGNKIIKHQNLSRDLKKMLYKFTIELNGNCNNLECICNAKIKGNVNGRVKAEDSITCEGITGDAIAGDSINCKGNIAGNASAGDGITVYGDVKGNISAGDSVHIGRS